MAKQPLIIIGVVVLAIVGAATYLATSSNDEQVMQEKMSQSQPQTQSANGDANSKTTTQQEPTASEGTYVDYSNNVIASTSGTKLLFFHASWCPQCRSLETDIKQQGVPSGTTIIKVDYDTNQSLRQKYGVTLQTTLVRVDDNGNLVKKYIAYDDPTLASVKQNLLE